MTYDAMAREALVVAAGIWLLSDDARLADDSTSNRFLHLAEEAFNEALQERMVG
jgi:hypothetical protein